MRNHKISIYQRDVTMYYGEYSRHMYIKRDNENPKGINLTDDIFFEKTPKGETVGERIIRLREEKRISLGLEVFILFWENQELIPKNLTNNRIFFDGTIFCENYWSEDENEEFVLVLDYVRDHWSWGYGFLWVVSNPNDLSVVLKD